MNARRFLITAFAVLTVAVVVSALPRAARVVRTKPTAAAGPKGKLVVENLGGPGEATKMPIRDYSWGIKNATTTTSGGAGAGKATFEDLTIEKLVDDNSVALARAVATGVHFPSATVTIYQPGTTTPQSIFTMSNVTISGVHHTHKTTNIETVTLAYPSIEWVYKAEAGDQTFCWDLAANAGC